MFKIICESVRNLVIKKNNELKNVLIRLETLKYSSLLELYFRGAYFFVSKE